MQSRPTMHCQAEIDADAGYQGFLPDEILLLRFHDRYSSSKHLLTMYSIARGMDAKTIKEIGFGRSSFALDKAVHVNSGRFISCDVINFLLRLSEKKKFVNQFIHIKSN